MLISRYLYCSIDISNDVDAIHWLLSKLDYQLI